MDQVTAPAPPPRIERSSASIHRVDEIDWDEPGQRDERFGGAEAPAVFDNHHILRRGGCADGLSKMT
jgi:hypothetical protein